MRGSPGAARPLVSSKNAMTSRRIDTGRNVSTYSSAVPRVRGSPPRRQSNAAVNCAPGWSALKRLSSARPAAREGSRGVSAPVADPSSTGSMSICPARRAVPPLASRSMAAHTAGAGRSIFGWRRAQACQRLGGAVAHFETRIGERLHERIDGPRRGSARQNARNAAAHGELARRIDERVGELPRPAVHAARQCARRVRRHRVPREQRDRLRNQHRIQRHGRTQNAARARGIAGAQVLQSRNDLVRGSEWRRARRRLRGHGAGMRRRQDRGVRRMQSARVATERRARDRSKDRGARRLVLGVAGIDRGTSFEQTLLQGPDVSGVKARREEQASDRDRHREPQENRMRRDDSGDEDSVDDERSEAFAQSIESHVHEGFRGSHHAPRDRRVEQLVARAKEGAAQRGFHGARRRDGRESGRDQRHDAEHRRGRGQAWRPCWRGRHGAEAAATPRTARRTSAPTLPRKTERRIARAPRIRGRRPAHGP